MLNGALQRLGPPARTYKPLPRVHMVRIGHTKPVLLLNVPQLHLLHLVLVILNFGWLVSNCPKCYYDSYGKCTFVISNLLSLAINCQIAKGPMIPNLDLQLRIKSEHTSD